MAQSGHSTGRVVMSAFGSKADMKWCCDESPLMTQSGHYGECAGSPNAPTAGKDLAFSTPPFSSKPSAEPERPPNGARRPP